jgi:hypothetical protein
MSTHATHTVHAIYQNGALTLLDPLDLPEGSWVQVDVHLTATEAALPLRTLPARRLRPLVGVASLGGDAVADSEALYDANWG